MGYNFSDQPPQNWFCARKFLEAPIALLRKPTPVPLSINAICEISGSKVDIVRAVRVALGLVPAFRDKAGLNDLRAHLAPDKFKEFSDLLCMPDAYTVAGGSYYAPRVTRNADGKCWMIADKAEGLEEALAAADNEQREEIKKLYVFTRDEVFFKMLYYPHLKSEFISAALTSDWLYHDLAKQLRLNHPSLGEDEIKRLLLQEDYTESDLLRPLVNQLVMRSECGTHRGNFWFFSDDYSGGDCFY